MNLHLRPPRLIRPLKYIPQLFTNNHHPSPPHLSPFPFSRSYSQPSQPSSSPPSKCMHRSDPNKPSNQIVTPPSLTTLQFWSSIPTWKRAGINTFRCLIGCTLGDFSAMWYLQAFHADLGIAPIMAISMATGISTSIILETLLLRIGRDDLTLSASFRTAIGMSIISMTTMEVAENAVDFHLTGGMIDVHSPMFWFAAVVSISAGFLSPLPYNYLRLRRFGKACH